MSGVSAGPAQNRVLPTGEIVPVAGRGGWTGNRGRLHDGAGSRRVVRLHRSRAWITCRLQFRDRRIEQWHPRRYTPLFFADEAVALAAGHRPCAECRYADFVAFRDAWARGAGVGRPRAGDLDERLHAERLPVGARRPTFEMSWGDVPSGAFVRLDPDDRLAVVTGDHLRLWESSGYRYAGSRQRPGAGPARVLTPPTALTALRLGYRPQLHRPS